MRAVLLATFLCALTPAAWAVETASAPVSVPVRIGEHDGFGRVVFDFPKPPVWHMERHGDEVTLSFAAEDQVIAPGGAVPRNVRAIAGGAGRALIRVVPGAELRVTRIGNRLALDILSPPPARASSAAAAAAAGPPAAATPAPSHHAAIKRHLPKAMPALVPAPALLPAAATPAPVAPNAAPVAVTATEDVDGLPAGPVTHVNAAGEDADAEPQRSLPDIVATLPGAVGPMALAAMRVDPPAEWGGAAIVLPFAPGTGAAAFRRGSEALVVFDEVRPVDLAGLRGDPFFGHAVVQELPAGTLLRLPLAPEASLALRPSGRGWLVVETVKPPPLTPIDPATELAGQAAPPPAASGGLGKAEGQKAAQAAPAAAAPNASGAMNVTLVAHNAAHVVMLDDPQTGGNLLVGTQRSAGEGVEVARHTPEFALLPSWMGVAVEAFSDRPVLRVTKDGFLLTAGGEQPGLAVSAIMPGAAALARAMTLTRHFDFPDLPTAVLQRHLQAAIDDAAAVPARARGAARRDVATTMIALGLGPEAQAVLRLATLEDPAAASDPDMIGLAAIAALVAERPAEAAGIDDPRQPASDELNLWRAVRHAMLDPQSEAAAAGFAAETRLILAYPASLRARLLPLAGETMVRGGQVAAAAALLADQKGDPSLDFARALVAEKQGDGNAALALYDRLANSPDRLVHARAARRAVEMRLTSGALTPAQAAEAEDRLLYAWRGDGRELAARLRLAALRQQAGQWRQELALLRESESLFPAERPAIHARLLQAFADLLQSDGDTSLSPLDLVALVQENGDLLPDGAAGEGLVARFADQLAALDLPGQAAQVFEKLIKNATSASARAKFGARLAALRLDEHDYAGAQAALDASKGDGLSPALLAERARLAARVAAGRGNLALAMSLLADQTGVDAAETRASLLEAAHDWPAAEAALAAYVTVAVPADGPLSDNSGRIVLRLASAAAQANDEARLAELAHTYGDRFAEGPLAQMFRVLTGKPVQGVGDLPQVTKGIAAARALPVALQALGTGLPTN
ncbi:MAG: hypothetical protein ACP5M5_06210 [Acidibrevibacterium sp.]|uniref:hypothetical protein n=1 Tax=Acidibrevibacterium sp. TaxID=2606776 RepID=UPI003CFC7D3A